MLSLIESWDFLQKDIDSLCSSDKFSVDRENFHGVFSAAFITLYCQKKLSQGKCSNIIVAVPGEYECQSFSTDFSTIFPESNVYVIPAWETIPYRPASKRSAVFGKRAAFLSMLSKIKFDKNKNETETPAANIFIIPERVFITPLPPPEYIASLSVSFKKGENLDIIKISEKLSLLGYIRVPRVTVSGEFSLRGEVLDIFPPYGNYAVRITFDFDTIEQIKFFDAELQTTTGKTDSVIIPPMKEIIWTDDLITRLTEGIDEYLKSDVPTHLPFTDEAGKKYSLMIDDLMEKGECEGEEFFYPILSQKKSENLPYYTILDYVDAETAVFFSDYARIKNGEELIAREYSGMYRTARLENPVLPPDMMLVNFQTISENIKKEIRLNSFVKIVQKEESEGVEDKAARENNFAEIGNETASSSAENEATDTMNSVYQTAETSKNSSFFTSETENFSKQSQENMPKMRSVYQNELLGCDVGRNSVYQSGQIVNSQFSIVNYKIEPSHSFFGNIAYFRETIQKNQEDGWKIFVYVDGENQAARIETLLEEFCSAKNKNRLEVLPNSISAGFSIPEIKLLVIQENEIFGRKKRKIPKSLSKVKSQAIDTFVELNPGDYVVHVNYGIGKFLGIERVKAAGHERDYIKIEYAGEEFAFVPIEQVNLVQRYIGSEGEHPRLDHIGSKNWENRKNKVKQAVEELAGKLIDLYSRRASSTGIAFPEDTEWQVAFEASFPYEDTPDQATATEEIKADMERAVPMDRLICGDVGYGKTEIAMRAAFKAIMGGKQVAFLAPTTILAEQHFETCTERFRNFPVKIGLLSRFVSLKDQKKTLEALAKGEIDLVIGTHRIIQKDVVFKNLGLMIIDEEQRFGVKDKEKLKVMRNNIDCLTLSATPIPRTLHMSLLKIRDMSLLATPPQNRQPIETEVAPYDDEKVARAIRREVERGGQVFFLHNRVESLLEIKRRLENILPEMMIETANGQMPGDQLDDIFRRFKLGGFHILVATTIIENGIDIPNVNTIIIDRADMYGVSQLYQLRGRVGRSDRKAYAYLFYPENSALSEVAMKRLQVISDFTELGSGFKIAMKDMEIRGAGNLLGRDQSGEVYAVGFDLYMRLLNDAIEKLMTSGEYKAQSEVLLELEYTGFIPSGYIENTQTKMEVYKKIAAVQTEAELMAIQTELEDRFGPVPEEVLSLLSLAEIRVLCAKLNIASVKETKGVVQVEFTKVSDISIDKLLTLINTSAGTVTLNQEKPNMIFLKLGKIGLKEKSEYIREKLSVLS